MQAWHHKPSPIAFLGAGGHASDLLTVVEAWTDLLDLDPKIYLADDSWPIASERFDGRVALALSGSIGDCVAVAPFLASVGYPGPRQQLVRRALRLGGEPAGALIHPRAEVSSNAELGLGSAAMGCLWISPGVVVGQHAYLGYGSTVGHDTFVGDFTSIMPGSSVGGEVKIGTGCMVGANSTVLQGVRVGNGAIVGAGSVVTKDVDPGSTVVGVPAKARQETQDR